MELKRWRESAKWGGGWEPGGCAHMFSRGVLWPPLVIERQ